MWLSVCAAAAAIAAEPIPASLLNTPLPTPKRIEFIIVAVSVPAIPPATDLPEKAITKMFFRPSGIPEMLPKITTRPATI